MNVNVSGRPVVIENGVKPFVVKFRSAVSAGASHQPSIEAARAKAVQLLEDGRAVSVVISGPNGFVERWE